jgi:Uma2 family endonuclease
LQHGLLDLLRSKLRHFGVVRIEYPYRALAEFDLRAADVAVVAHERYHAVDPDDNLRGSPDLVIEVRSPSNTQKTLQERVALCLANGARECWIVDPRQKSVSVVRGEGATLLYRAGASVPLTAFGSDAIPVDDIFSESSHR